MTELPFSAKCQDHRLVFHFHHNIKHKAADKSSRQSLLKEFKPRAIHLAKSEIKINKNRI